MYDVCRTNLAVYIQNQMFEMFVLGLARFALNQET